MFPAERIDSNLKNLTTVEDASFWRFEGFQGHGNCKRHANSASRACRLCRSTSWRSITRLAWGYDEAQGSPFTPVVVGFEELGSAGFMR